MELKNLDCPFCQGISDWEVEGVEFEGNEVYMRTSCPKCKKTVILSIPIVFNQMKMFVTPQSKNVTAEMLPPKPQSAEGNKPLDAEIVDKDKIETSAL